MAKVINVNDVCYAEKYCAEDFEYRHVQIPKESAKLIPTTHLMTETEWRNLGIQQSPGWIHYMIHNPEPHVLLFRRPRKVDTVDAGNANESSSALDTSNGTLV